MPDADPRIETQPARLRAAVGGYATARLRSDCAGDRHAAAPDSAALSLSLYRDIDQAQRAEQTAGDELDAALDRVATGTELDDAIAAATDLRGEARGLDLYGDVMARVARAWRRRLPG